MRRSKLIRLFELSTCEDGGILNKKWSILAAVSEARAHIRNCGRSAVRQVLSSLVRIMQACSIKLRRASISSKTF